MTKRFDPEVIARAVSSPRWSALVRTGLDLASVGRFDPTLLRETRVLVPIDVQALVVPNGSTEPMVRLPLSIAAPDGQPPPPATAILEDGPPRPAGVHLHWALPDALLRGSLGDHGEGNRLQLPPLPDRWVVLRLLVPKGAERPLASGWVIEADTTRVVPLAEWPAGAASAVPSGRTVAGEELHGACGGSLNWTGVYDATLNRFAFHDPLADLPSLAPKGVEGDQAAYLVAGWWTDPRHDPLDGAQTTASLHDRVRQLGWSLVEDREDNDKLSRERVQQQARQATLGLHSASRYAPVQAARLERAAPLGVESVTPKKGLTPAASTFAHEAKAVVQSEPGWPRSSLLHGSVYGVPVSGTPAAVTSVDNRPQASDVELVWGEQGNDLAAVLASSALAPSDADERRAYERLLAGFTGNLLDRVDSSDGLVDVEEWEHAAGFVSRPGGDGGVDRLVDGRDGASLSAGRLARGTAARGKTAGAAPGKKDPRSILDFAHRRSDLKAKTKDAHRDEMLAWGDARAGVKTGVDASGASSGRPASNTGAPAPGRPSQPGTPASREVTRPAPRLYIPAEPMLAVRGARRSLRHGGDGKFSPDGRLHCRYPSQVIRAIDQVVDGAELVPSLGSAALPDEVTLLAREAALHNPYWTVWLAASSAQRRGLDASATRKRVTAEAALRFGNGKAVYDGSSGAFSRKVGTAGGRTRTLTDELIADQLRRFSLVVGTDPDPVGVTAWSQPWVPLWLEWELELALGDRLEGWRLGPVDLDPKETDGPAPPILRSVRGRSVLTTGTAITLSAAVRAWLQAEDERDADNRGEASESTEAALARIAVAVEQLDVLAASFDGVREQLLGLAYDGGLARVRQPDGTLGPPSLNGQAPLWLRGGAARVARARLVDAFGRVLALPVERLRVPQRLAVPDSPTALQLSPRLNVPARLLLRLVDPAAPGATAAEANVDQIDPTRMINPVAGFLLPDHIDEALEVFDAAGTPLGQLSHEPISGGVMWEIAPGRDGPVDAGPLHGLAGGAQHLGFFAAGVVAADAQARGGEAAAALQESALSALLRAIDTTMWSVDALRGLGTEHIAGLVGRPMAVVRARLQIDLQPEHGVDAQTVAAALADRAFTVRVGEITRADDGLLAYFVDDDYEHVHVVDKVVAQLARDSGRQRGQLGRLDTAPQLPDTRPITHPYVVAEDELQVRPGQTVLLTLLMHPGGKAHLSSGVLPRKSVQLARDWVAPGLSVIAPSARVGPVLIDTAQVRLPKISAFPKDQLFTRRDTPSTWKDDPILAATQEALLPDLPHEVQEGYIRISPEPLEPPEGSP